MTVWFLTVLQLRRVRLYLQAAVDQEIVFVQSFCDVIAEVGDGVDDGWLFSSARVIFLHQVILQRDEVQRVVGDAAAVHLHGDGVVDQDHQTPERKREGIDVFMLFWAMNFVPSVKIFATCLYFWRIHEPECYN